MAETETKTIDDGGSAFPTTTGIGINDEEVTKAVHGMSLRDYFAAKAMAALLVQDTEAGSNAEKCAVWAYRWADAMIKTRKAGAQ